MTGDAVHTQRRWSSNRRRSRLRRIAQSKNSLRELDPRRLSESSTGIAISIPARPGRRPAFRPTSTSFQRSHDPTTGARAFGKQNLRMNAIIRRLRKSPPLEGLAPSITRPRAIGRRDHRVSTDRAARTELTLRKKYRHFRLLAARVAPAHAEIATRCQKGLVKSARISKSKNRKVASGDRRARPRLPPGQAGSQSSIAVARKEYLNRRIHELAILVQAGASHVGCG